MVDQSFRPVFVLSAEEIRQRDRCGYGIISNVHVRSQLDTTRA